MRRGATTADIVVWCCLCFGAGAVGAWSAATYLGPATDATPVVAPVPAPAAEPELVIVTDSSGRRVTDAAVETAAAKLSVGQWTVHAIPKPGDTGWTRTVTVSGGPSPQPQPQPNPQPIPTPGPQPAPATPPLVLMLHESSHGELPAYARGAANDLTAAGREVRMVDDDVLDGTGETPAWLKPALDAGRALMGGSDGADDALLLLDGERIVKALKLPGTKEAILEAAK